MTTLHDLKALILSFHPLVVIETNEEERVSSILLSAGDELRLGVFEWSITTGLRSVRQGEPIKGTTEPKMLLDYLRENEHETIYYLKDFTRYLEDARVERAFREILDQFTRTQATIFISGNAVKLPEAIEHYAVFHELALPSRDDLRGLVRSVVGSLREKRGISVSLSPDEASGLVDSLAGLTLAQARQALAWSMVRDGKLTGEDISAIRERKGQLLKLSGLLEYYPIDTNDFELGGFDKLKAWLDRARVGFSPAAKSLNLTPPRGVLFVGVQGCGKSLASKFIAKYWNLPLLKLDAGRLYDKFMGESEKNMRRAIAIAESMAPAVLWIDEIEKAFASSGSAEYDGGVSRRLLGSFLTWLQEKKDEVFVAGTANDIRALPPEFLRKGRFDEIFFVDLPDEDERREIARIHLELRKQVPDDFYLDRLVEATAGFSGAEIEQAVISSLYRALHKGSQLTDEILLAEVSETVPLSVSRAEDIQHLRTTAEGRFVKVRLGVGEE